ncbi:hypothetical protein FA95DRAFT_1332555 [Auriscalpium vulgare]|uniref:Uncharacterized protein n=1 Tax=Auriscalpium vulgare TaxID=40419 RepID=A0ACB8S7F2_9AGAM|nr:hypothetical protein FA95DRAFT_1332555 [Auriscalpium vulgare]
MQRSERSDWLPRSFTLDKPKQASHSTPALQMLRSEDLPTGVTPGWEHDEEITEEDAQEDVGPLKSVPDSFVLVNSLTGSRAKWISSTFPKFSSKTRGGKAAPEPVPPAHAARLLGKLDLHIGPHIFSDVSLYEAHYVPPTQRPPNPPVAHPGTWQAAAAYGSTQFVPYSQYAAQYPSSMPQAAAPSAPTPFSSPPGEMPMTAATVKRVNDAAISDPILANFLHLAATGRATHEQLQTLQLLIRSLAAVPDSTPSSSTPASTPTPSSAVTPSTQTQAPATYPVAPQASAAPIPMPTYQYPYAYAAPVQYPPAPVVPPKEHDIVLEFREKASDRWLLPRGPVDLERSPADGTIREILLSVVLPFSQTEKAPTNPGSETPAPAAEPPVEVTQEVVRLRLTKATQTVWDALMHWAGGQAKLETNKGILRSIKPPERVYLGYQLREGDLLTQLQNAAAPPFTMKTIKPAYGDKARPKRKAPVRKTVGDASAAPVAPKRRKSTQEKTTAVVKQKIACVSCGQTDVPLMMGGRYCRPCVESGKAQPVAYPPLSTPGAAVPVPNPAASVASATAPAAAAALIPPTVPTTTVPPQ